MAVKENIKEYQGRGDKTVTNGFNVNNPDVPQSNNQEDKLGVGVRRNDKKRDIEKYGKSVTSSKGCRFEKDDYTARSRWCDLGCWCVCGCC